MIRVGLIGTGYIGTVHLEQLRRLGGVVVTRVVDSNVELAKKAAAPFGIEQISDDYRDVVNDPAIDVIHNCTPNKLHFQINKEALRQGKQVMSEKPLAMTAAEAQELYELAREKNAVTGINFCYRYYPVVQEVAARIRKGRLGDLRMVFGTWFQDWLSTDKDYTWRLEPSEAGASNITADLGSHWFDLIQFLTGRKVTEVMGDFATMIPVRQKPKQQVLAFQHVEEVETEPFNCTLEEYSSIHFRLDGGVPGSFTTCQVCNGRKSDPSFEICGSECSYAWSHEDATRLWIGNRFKPNEEMIENAQIMEPEAGRFATLPAGHPLGYNDSVYHLFKDYYAAIEAGEGASDDTLRPTFLTGYEEMKILEAIVSSHKKRRWETLGY